jgi:hypothetical protein
VRYFGWLVADIGSAEDSGRLFRILLLLNLREDRR